MGKKGSWFSAVKKVFRSPSKDYVKTTPRDLDLVGDLPPLEVSSSLPLGHIYPTSNLTFENILLA